MRKAVILWKTVYNYSRKEGMHMDSKAYVKQAVMFNMIPGLSYIALAVCSYFKLDVLAIVFAVIAAVSLLGYIIKEKGKISQPLSSSASIAMRVFLIAILAVSCFSIAINIFDIQFPMDIGIVIDMLLGILWTLTGIISLKNRNAEAA